MPHILHPFGSTCRVKNEVTTAKRSVVATTVVARTSSELRHGLRTYALRHSRVSMLFSGRSRFSGTPKPASFRSSTRPRRTCSRCPPINGGPEPGIADFSAFRRSSVSGFERSYLAEVKPCRFVSLAGDPLAVARSAVVGVVAGLSRGVSGASSGREPEECLCIESRCVMHPPEETTLRRRPGRSTFARNERRG